MLQRRFPKSDESRKLVSDILRDTREGRTKCVGCGRDLPPPRMFDTSPPTCWRCHLALWLGPMKGRR